MGYVITNGKVFLTNQGLLSDQAYQWKKEKSAENYLNHWLESKGNVELKEKLQVQVFQKQAPNDDAKPSETMSNPILESIRKRDMFVQDVQSFDSSNELYKEDCLKLFSMLDEATKTIHTVLRSVEERKSFLTKQLSEMDKEIADIQHYIELAPIQNAPNGYKLYKFLRERLTKRRYYKDELILISAIDTHNFDEFFIRQVKKHMDGLENRSYAIRSENEEIKSMFDKLNNKNIK